MKKNLLIIFIFASKTYGLECPSDAYQVDVDISFSQKKTSFCQKSYNGEFVKHGPEITFDLKGNILEENYYDHDSKVAKPLEKTPSDGVDSPCKWGEEYARKMMEGLFVSDISSFFSKKERTVMKCKKCCKAFPKKRINFFISGKPYTNKLGEREDCKFKGDLIFKFDEKIKTEFEIRNELFFDKLKISYELTKNVKNKVTEVKATILKGELSHKNNEKRVVFSGEQVFEIKSGELMTNGGRRGLYSQPLKIKIHAWNKTKCD